MRHLQQPEWAGEFYAIAETDPPQLVRRMKELQPEASSRAIAEAVGVSKSTIHRDMAGVPKGTLAAHNGQPVEPQPSTTVPHGTPPEAEVEDLPASLGPTGGKLRQDLIGAYTAQKRSVLAIIGAASSRFLSS